MNILMVTNTFTPHVGGVARSVEAFSHAYVEKGHQVMVVAPEFENMPEHEENVFRVPAIQHFNGSDFSVRLPIPVHFTDAFEAFRPDIVHSHHPFMLGSTALHIAHLYHLPLVFTHHTMYERYTHYVPGDSEAMKRFVIALSTGYANLSNQVIAPSESTAAELKRRGVTIPIAAIPTGVDVDRFSRGDRAKMRKTLEIPEGAFVVGHVGRLAPEKNLTILAQSVCNFMQQHGDAHFILAGEGPSKSEMLAIFETAGMLPKIHCTGNLTGDTLVNCYASMNVFAFASFTETQGMVITEAMAAGVPVVAIDAPGAREVIIDTVNGRLLPHEDVGEFAQALAWVADRETDEYNRLSQAALDRAHVFSIDACSDRALQLYESVRERDTLPDVAEGSAWESAIERVATEWQIFSNAAGAAGVAIGLTSPDTNPPDA